MSRFPKWWLIAPLLLLAALLFSRAQDASTEIRYDELLQRVRGDQVESVVLQGETVRGVLKEGDRPFRTVRPEDDRFIALLEEYEVEIRVLPVPQTPWWTYLIWLGLPLFLLWMISSRMNQQAGALSFGRSKGKIFTERDIKVTFDDVAGVDEAKAELREVIDFLKQPNKYRRFGARIPKGILLVGPPGTGKTLLARAVAGEAGVPFISISGSEFVEMFVGVGAARVRDLFDQATQAAPAIVFIDELDALGRARAGNMPGSHEEREQTLNQLLVELDGFEPLGEGHGPVVLLAATNRPEILDPALLRAGRFDRQVVVDRPDRAGRRKILDVHVQPVPLDDDVDLDVIAARTPGFAGADLANLVNEAALRAAGTDRDTVTMDDFSGSIDRVIAGLEQKSRLMDADERRRVAYHEAGHALATTYGGSAQKVHKISIVPRSIGALGFTMQLPTREQRLATKGELAAQIVALLGGRAAEELVFGEPSTGAADDLRKATDLARAMVLEHGFSDAVGPVALERRRPMYLPGLPSSTADGGPAVSDAADRAIRELVESSLARAHRILEEHRDALEGLAQDLLAMEHLEGDELAKWLTKEATEDPENTAAEPA